MDAILERIGDARAAGNEAKQNEREAVSDALAHMVRNGYNVRKHAGVEVSRVPGAEKLRVRLTKETGDADESDYEPAAGEDAGGEAEQLETQG